MLRSWKASSAVKTPKPEESSTPPCAAPQSSYLLFSGRGNTSFRSCLYTMQHRYPSTLLRLPSKSILARYFSSTMSSNAYVKRTTLFKIPKEEDIETVLKQYEKLRKTAAKVRRTPLAPIVVDPFSHNVSSDYSAWLLGRQALHRLQRRTAGGQYVVSSERGFYDLVAVDFPESRGS